MSNNGKTQQKAQFIEMRAKGYSYSKIAEQIKVSKGTLVNWNSELVKEIEELKAKELESLQDQFYFTKQGRLRLLGEIQSKIREELISRDFRDVPTERLLSMFIKYSEALKSEFVEVRPEINTEIGIKLNENEITNELNRVLVSYRAGIITREQANMETSMLNLLLKSREKEQYTMAKKKEQKKREELKAKIKEKRKWLLEKNTCLWSVLENMVDLKYPELDDLPEEEYFLYEQEAFKDLLPYIRDGSLNPIYAQGKEEVLKLLFDEAVERGELIEKDLEEFWYISFSNIELYRIGHPSVVEAINDPLGSLEPTDVFEEVDSLNIKNMLNRTK